MPVFTTGCAREPMRNVSGKSLQKPLAGWILNDA
jgi:hypothetical protein